VDALFFLALAMLFFGPLFLMPRQARGKWLGLFAGFTVALAAWEAISYFSTGLTLSQLFWTFSESSPVAAWAIIGSLDVGWLLVLLHLARRLIKK
jgi:membrane-bound metal-dependent hydrolase YbcI (DUF457 family)